MLHARQSHDEDSRGTVRESARVALVTNVLAHYRVPCFRALARQLGERFTLFLLSKGMEHRRYVEADDASDLEPVTLSGIRLHRPPADDRHLSDLRPVLRGRFDVLILSGWGEPTYLLLWLWCLISRTRCLFWIESTPAESTTTGFRGFLKRLIVRWSSGCLVPGARASALCRSLGVPQEKIFIAPNATDRSFFRSQAEALAVERDSLRADMRLDSLTVLFVGRLVEAIKGINTLIDACATLEQRGLELSLLIVGEGPDRSSYEERIVRSGMSDARLLGTLDHPSLCRVYAAADVLVLPSRSETWGFVLNEAMEFSLPLVVSDAVGAGPDLVRGGVSGLTVAAGDVGALTQALERLLSDDELRRRLGSGARRLVEEYSPQAWARGVLRAIGASV